MVNITLKRLGYTERIHRALSRSPVVAVLGPRQSGKTTLAKRIAARHPETQFFDLESTQDAQRLTNAELVLRPLKGLVVLDEIQLKPALFQTLRELVDDESCEAKFLVLGSASPDLTTGASESLAGRVEFIDLHGFDVSEVGRDAAQMLWIRGGFPRSFLAESDEDSGAWREEFVRTFLERDMPKLGIRISSHGMRRFWTMLAHSHGHIWNASKLAGSMGVSDKTTRSYLDVLSDTYLIRQLQPWYASTKKRQVKSPKIYLRDSGILHHLLSIGSAHTLQAHPAHGGSWEGFGIEQILRTGLFPDPYFWAVHSGAELDLLTFYEGNPIGFEFKVNANPTITRSMNTAMTLLKLRHLFVVCPTPNPYPISDQTTVCAPWDVQELLKTLRL